MIILYRICKITTIIQSIFGLLKVWYCSVVFLWFTHTLTTQKEIFLVTNECRKESLVTEFQNGKDIILTSLLLIRFDFIELWKGFKPPKHNFNFFLTQIGIGIPPCFCVVFLHRNCVQTSNNIAYCFRRFEIKVYWEKIIMFLAEEKVWTFGGAIFWKEKCIWYGHFTSHLQ